jgi:hypothetical protein
LTASRPFTAIRIAKTLANGGGAGPSEFHTIIFKQGRQIIRAGGLLPSALSVTHGSRKTPHIAIDQWRRAGLVVMFTARLKTHKDTDNFLVRYKRPG